MTKKILLFTAFALLIGLLIFGAVNRTLAKNGEESSGGRRRTAVSEGENASGGRRSPGSTQGSQANNGSQHDPAEETGSGGQYRGGNAKASGNGQGYARQNEDHSEGQWLDAPGTVTEAEAAALQFMREEEKLARDIYRLLYETWGVQAFYNISSSEQAHMDSVKSLLDRYSLQDPASSQAGVFTNPDLQALYDELAARGITSELEALKVGAFIEEVDIQDLQSRLLQVTNPEVRQVFESLLAGSTNHLRAFSRQVENRTGVAYEPQVMSQAEFNAILSSAPAGQGMQGQAGEKRGQGRGSGQGQGRQP
jgi:hypothetical protein